MPIQNTDKLPTIAAFLILIVLIAGFVPSLMANTSDVATQTVTQTEGNEYQLSGYLSADLTEVRDGMTFTEVASIHTTDTDFSNANTLDNVEVVGLGESALVSIISNLIDGFEDGDISGWTGDTDSFTATQTTSFSGSWSMVLDSTGSVVFVDRSFTSDSYGNLSIAVNDDVNSADGRPVVSWKSGSDNVIRMAVINGNLRIQPAGGGTFQNTGISLSSNTWYNIVVYNIDYGSNTHDIIVYDINGNEVGRDTNLDFETNAAEIDNVRVIGEDTDFNIDDVRAGVDASGDGTYISETHSVNGAETGFADVSLTDATATITWEADTDGDGVFETTISETSHTSSGNYTVDLSGTPGQNWRVNVTFTDATGGSVAELEDEGILTTTTEGTDTSVTLVDAKTGQTVDTGPINETETRQFTIGFETVTVTNEDVLSDNRSLMTYEYPRYYGYNPIVTQFGELIGLIILVIFVYLMYSIFFPEEKQ